MQPAGDESLYEEHLVLIKSGKLDHVYRVGAEIPETTHYGNAFAGTGPVGIAFEGCKHTVSYCFDNANVRPVGRRA